MEYYTTTTAILYATTPSSPALTRDANHYHGHPQSHTIPVPSSHQGCRQRRRHAPAPCGVEGGGETGLTPNSADGAGLPPSAQQATQTMRTADPQRVLHRDGGEGGGEGEREERWGKVRGGG